MEIVFPHVS